MEMLKRFIKDERGLETVEYAIILGLIVGATIMLVIALGNWVALQFTNVGSKLPGYVAPGA